MILSARTNDISFVRVVFSFDSTKVKLSTEFTPTASFFDVVEKTTRHEANVTGLASLTLVVPPNNPLPTGVIEVASFSLSAATTIKNASTPLIFFTSDMQAVTDEGKIPKINASDAIINLNVVPTNLPTKMPTRIQ